MCLGTFSRRARSLATCFCFARVRIIGTLVPFCVTGNSKEFPVTQKKAATRMPNEYFPVRILLFVTACLSLSNAAIFTCVLLFTHTCPVTEFTVASHLNTANSCCHHVFLRHFRFQKCLPVNSNTCVPQSLTPSSLSARRDRAAAFQPPSCQSSGESAF